MNAFDQLCYLYGVGSEFTKYTGETVKFSDDVKRTALTACNVDFSSENDIAALNYEIDVKPWHQLVQKVSMVSNNQPMLLVRVRKEDIDLPVHVEIKEIDISCSFTLYDACVVGDYIDGNQHFLELKLPLADNLPIGYFEAKVSLKNQSFNTELWSVPEKAFSFSSKKQLGVSVQLYTLSSEMNYGFGDFDDLKVLIEYSAAKDIDYILLNPLHLLFEEEPQRASPYSPSHRGLINPLYISISECVKQSTFAYLEDEHISALAVLDQEKKQPFIDYELVSETKYKVLKSLYRHFKHHADTDIQRRFRRYCNQNHNLLQPFADNERAKFWQWLAHEQLYDCQKLCIDLGMSTGLINDLAVGCSKDGLEYKDNAAIFTNNAEVGAPPDPWADKGQNWGLPAINPKRISDNQFAYFKTLIQANMHNFGGLRIDHVMSLRRLWWCFKINGNQEGCYIYYPFEHLLAILKIESHLNQCSLVGEDLGVVPPEVTSALFDSGIYGNTLFYFEKNHCGNFKYGNDYRSTCMLMLSNHDVPPFVSWWNAHDIKLRHQLSLCSDEEADHLNQGRIEDKYKVLAWINDAQLDINSQAENVFAVLTKSLSQTPPKLFTLNFDDLAYATLPVNIPGTDKEYTNWRRRILSSTESIFALQTGLLKDITTLRKDND